MPIEKNQIHIQGGWRGDLNFLKLAADMYNVHQLQYVWTMSCVYVYIMYMNRLDRLVELAVY